MEGMEPIQGAEALPRLFDLLAERTGPDVDALDVWGSPALAHDQGGAKPDLQGELALRTLRGVREGREHFQPLREVCDRLHMGRMLDGALACFEPVSDGWLTETRLRVVMCEQFGLRLSSLGKLGFQDLGNALMVLLPRALQQRFVGSIPNERMF